eukprot:COSAG01_NODE_40862_length_458_cov_6.013928_1_plen_33_part_10
MAQHEVVATEITPRQLSGSACAAGTRSIPVLRH